MKLDNEDVLEILRLLDGTPYNELHLEMEEFKLSLRRSGGQWTQTREVLSRPAVERTTVAATAAAGPRAPDMPAREGLAEVRTPLPGTFYRAPQPGAPPFVEIGSPVEETTVVCIIETMKLMNSIVAGVRGRVVDICLDNGQFTEKDAVLMRIETDGA